MRHTKRIASLLLALIMVFALAVTVSARTEVDTKGSILIKNNDTVLASEKTFAAYKVLDLKAFYDDSGVISTFEYSVPAGLVDFYADRYNIADTTSTDFIVKVTDGIKAETDLFAFAQAVAAAAASQTAYTGAAVTGGYQFSELPLGYYAIVDTTTTGDYVKPVTALVVDTVTPNVEIEVKADKPGIDKNIDKDNDLDTDNDRVDANQAAIGDTVTYVLESKVPEMIGYKKYFFIMNDTMSKGLTYTNNMVVTVGDKTLAEGTDYTLTKTDNADGSTSLRIVFNNFLQYNTDEFIGEPVVVTYTAMLDEDAVLSPEANPNQVYLEYSDDPSVEYSGENEPDDDDDGDKPGEDVGKPPLGQTPVVTVETFTTAIELIKVDALGNRLTGAEFTLTGEAMNIVRVTKSSFVADAEGEYWLLKDGSYTTTDPNSTVDGVPVDADKYADVNQKYAQSLSVELKQTEGGTVSLNGAVGEDGILRFEGLAAGTYTITELKAPDGYNILDDELTVTVTFDEDDYTFDFAGAVESNGVGRITVVNQIGSELPSTGGIGTTVFYVVGGMLLMAAVVLLVTKKRMAA